MCVCVDVHIAVDKLALCFMIIIVGTFLSIMIVAVLFHCSAELLAANVHVLIVAVSLSFLVPLVLVLK